MMEDPAVFANSDSATCEIWESREALDSSFEPAKALRGACADEFGGDPT